MDNVYAGFGFDAEFVWNDRLGMIDRRGGDRRLRLVLWRLVFDGNCGGRFDDSARDADYGRCHDRLESEHGFRSRVGLRGGGFGVAFR